MLRTITELYYTEEQTFAPRIEVIFVVLKFDVEKNAADVISCFGLVVMNWFSVVSLNAV